MFLKRCPTEIFKLEPFKESLLGLYYYLQGSVPESTLPPELCSLNSALLAAVTLCSKVISLLSFILL
jgi:hypothetical protein